MTTASVPSTLVKCLYLFFDLPEMNEADITDANGESKPRQRRVALQKIFVQVKVFNFYTSLKIFSTRTVKTGATLYHFS